MECGHCLGQEFPVLGRLLAHRHFLGLGSGLGEGFGGLARSGFRWPEVRPSLIACWVIGGFSLTTATSSSAAEAVEAQRPV